MLIIGAGGLAREVLEIVYRQQAATDIFFYDDVTQDGPLFLYDRFPVIKDIAGAKAYFQKTDNRFTLGVGKPLIRYELDQKLSGIGGLITSVISNDAQVGSFGNQIGEGVTFMQGVKITNSITIGKGCLLNLNCTIGHDSVIGAFCELSPGVHVSGHCRIGDFCSIGTNACILPGITLGNNVVVGAGAVVIKNIPDNTTVVGVPARDIRQTK